jgi:hypothetical protein
MKVFSTRAGSDSGQSKKEMSVRQVQMASVVERDQHSRGFVDVVFVKLSLIA